MKPIELTLYDPETNEQKETYSRSFVPWMILKRALRLSKILNKGIDNFGDEDLDEIAALVVAVFGDKFTIADLDRGADTAEMMNVIQAVITRAGQFVGGEKPPANGPNPTPAAK
jgi:hypothetical protein